MNRGADREGRRLESLQVGRALAALAVVLHHANLAAASFGGWSNPLFDYGFLGVDFFFVLSGFIIAFSVVGKRPGDYAWHRFRRVYLPYWPIGIGIAVMYVLLPGISESGGRDWSWLSTLTLLPIDTGPALSVAWTLQHEVLFYAIFGMAWFSGRPAAGLGLWIIAILASWWTGWDARIVQPINLEFLFGVLAFLAYQRAIGSKWLFAAGAIAFAIWWLLGGQRELSVMVGLALACCIPPVLAMEARGMRVPAFLSKLGNASYSIYLAHGLAISIFVRLAPPYIFITSFAVGTLGGLAYYWAVERNALRITPKNILNSPNRHKIA